MARGHALRSSQPTTQPEETKPTSPNIGPFRQTPDPAPPPLPAAAQNGPASRFTEAAEAQALADESFRIRRQAMFADAMAKYGKK